MRTWTSILAAVLSLAAVPALAASCKVKDLPQKFAILPDFIVLEKGEEWRNALTRVLGCELPQPTLPSLASGQKVEPMVMIGKDVFNAKGDNVGVITDVVVDQQSFKVESVVKLKAELGAKEVAIPVAAIDSTNGTFSLPDRWSTSAANLAAFHADNNSVSLAKTSLLDAFMPPVQIKLRVNSEPSGATFFAHDRAYGPTEINGLLNPTYKMSIRLEKQGYKPCKFSDGTYTDPIGTIEYATFQCKLTQQ